MGNDGQWGRLPQRQTQRTAGSEDIATSAQTLQPLAEREGLAYEPQLALEERSWPLVRDSSVELDVGGENVRARFVAFGGYLEQQVSVVDAEWNHDIRPLYVLQQRFEGSAHQSCRQAPVERG